jgi:endonuclease/exonuclease/phosphatase family metal-dependent hydrolase
VGFAIRKSIAHRCEADLQSLAIEGRNRRGALLLLAPGTPQAIRLLAVHLKSGCANDPADPGKAACQTLAAQMQLLGEWVRVQSAQTPLVVLGDFNRVGPAQDDPLWQQLPLINAAEGQSFHNCFVGQPFTHFIDHILISDSLTKSLVAGSFRKQGYRTLDALRYRLSDHCPVSIKLRLQGTYR